jgi:polysaccharide biosynthesis protein VpsJ
VNEESEAAALEREARSAFDTASGLDWRSHDPFDLLLSPYLGGVRRRTPFGARVFVQIGKRSGARARSVLQVPTHEEPKALADYLRAAVLLSSEGRSWANPWVDLLAGKLLAIGNTPGWGLGFPYVSRFVNAAAGTPNAYTTTSVVEALLDAALVSGDPQAVERARDGMRFVVDELGAVTHGGRRWLRYWPDNDARIVNVQASTAGLLARLDSQVGDAQLGALADDLVDTVLAMQKPDGSWPYGDDPSGTFVDGFHTGFVLQSLTEYIRRRDDSTRTAPVADAIRLGLEFFHEHLMTPEGLPRGFADGGVSLDTQNVAQCIQTHVVCARDARDLTAAVRLWSATTGSPEDTALRWSLGPRVLATSYLLTALEDSPVAPPRSE